MRGSSLSRTGLGLESDELVSVGSSSVNMADEEEEDEQRLMWAALRRLPSYDRLRRALITTPLGEACEVDVSRLTIADRRVLLDRLFSGATPEDPYHFLSMIRDRMDRVGLHFPKVQVRYQQLSVQAEVHVGSRALPTIPNYMMNMAEGLFKCFGFSSGGKTKMSILEDVTGMIRPGRLTLLLGPPGAGKTTFLLALAGMLDKSLKVSGNVTYNGHDINEFVPQRTAAYVNERDLHLPELTVREVLDFSGRCQGVGNRYDMMVELTRRENYAGIQPDEIIDIFMKGIALGNEGSCKLVTDYIMRVMGLDVCSETLVGDELRRGISGGQVKRLTTGEVLVGPARVLYMDEISTGLDSSTAFQLTKFLRDSCRALDLTIVVCLLQPAPETYELFDDIILMSEGQIAYHGPRDYILQFLSTVGFKCPERKAVADFLQEVTSRKDQQQYWANSERDYRYISVREMCKAFKKFHVGKKLRTRLAVPFDKRRSDPGALSFSKYGVSKAELFKAGFWRETVILKRLVGLYVFRIIQISFVAAITSTVFIRTRMHHETVNDGITYLGALFFGILICLFNGFAETAVIVFRLPVLYRQRDMFMYPTWVYAFPAWILSIPVSLLESGLWVCATYYSIGFDSNVYRFLRQYLLLFAVHQTATGYFRFIAGVCREMVIVQTCGSMSMLVTMVLGGFILSKDHIRTWWRWGYWVSPLMYAQNAISLNEFLGHSWHKVFGTETLGVKILKYRDLVVQDYFFWIGVGVLVGYSVVFQNLFALSLAFLNPLKGQQTTISKQLLRERHANRTGENMIELSSVSAFSAVAKCRTEEGSNRRLESRISSSTTQQRRGMVLPFKPYNMCFKHINYYIDMPLEMKKMGVRGDRLQLLKDVSGAFRPGMMTALVGVSGAGKTTLMDVLAGRKTRGYIEGTITISGYPKKQETFARISGYCEQNDIHSPYVTVYESLIYSAWLRLPSEVDSDTREAFVEEVMELVELTSLQEALVGLPGVTGLSTEQRKRLTIAVELVANPSIIFMDEPTSGLDARAAAIVMRTVRNIVDTGRTIVCTIHQPSIDIFESFDELFLMKQGGQLIYAGPLGRNSQKLVEYLSSVGVPEIREGYNPATWMLEVTSVAEERRLGVDFAEMFKSSIIYHQNMELIETLSEPVSGATDIEFPSKYSQSFFGQFMACLWKQRRSYWRNPQYTAIRYIFTAAVSLVFGTVFWGLGSKRSNEEDLLNSMGALYLAVVFLGVANGAGVQPVVLVERLVLYREKAASMYDALPYAFAQVAVELPYVLIQSAIFLVLFYPMASYEWAWKKVLWFFFFMDITLLYSTFFGMMSVALTPEKNTAAIFTAPFYMLWNLFSGFLIPYKKIPVWWRWYYWANPYGWTLYGLIVSQYGDLTRSLETPDGRTLPVKHFIKEYFGFREDFLAISAAVSAAFALLFVFCFGWGIKFLNFQHR